MTLEEVDATLVQTIAELRQVMALLDERRQMRDLMELHEELGRCDRALASDSLSDAARAYLTGATEALRWMLGKNGRDGSAPPSAHPGAQKSRAP